MEYEAASIRNGTKCHFGSRLLATILCFPLHSLMRRWGPFLEAAEEAATEESQRVSGRLQGEQRLCCQGAAARFAAWRVRLAARNGVPSSLLGPLGAWPLAFESTEVRSDANLICFRAYIASAPPQVAWALRELPITEHLTEWLYLVPQQPLTVALLRADGRRSRCIMRTRVCSAVPCARCSSGSGGWHFRWLGPWTPTAAMLGCHHSELYEHSWPVGASGVISWPRPGEARW